MQIVIRRVALEQSRRNGRNGFSSELYGQKSTIGKGVTANPNYKKKLGRMGYVTDEDFEAKNWAPYGLTEWMSSNPQAKMNSLVAQNSELQLKAMERAAEADALAAKVRELEAKLQEKPTKKDNKTQE